jgi:hypothetical protein
MCFHNQEFSIVTKILRCPTSYCSTIKGSPHTMPDSLSDQGQALIGQFYQY